MLSYSRYGFITLVVIFLMGTFGCAGSSNAPVVPDESDKNATVGKTSHHTWGLWQFTADPVNGTLDVVQLRTGNLHLNALPFLEPPALVYLTLESLEFSGDIIETDIGLRHPFLGQHEYTGFDVCGVLITNGDVTGFDDIDLRMAGDGDTRLLNPDGYNRWWNPAEFPVNDGTIFSYTDGLLGVPEASADYNSTLNAYKYFCDDLGPDDPLSNVILENRGMFSAGQKNIRHYTIELGLEGLIFNYAVDACWRFPNGSSPWTLPDDFPPKANRAEAYRISINETDNTLWNDGSGLGGGLWLSIDVYDWYNADLNEVKVESPGNFDPVTSATPTAGGAGYSTYEIEILDATPGLGSINLLISVESENAGYGGLLPGKTITAYFTYKAAVSSEPGTIIYVDDSNTSGIENGTKAHPYNTIQEGVDAALDGYTVLVDDSGVAYEEQVDMKSGIIVKSSNWDDSDGANRAFIDGLDDPETYSVYLNSVENVTLDGFRIGFAGPWQLGFPVVDGTKMIGIDGGSDITVQDCLFEGQTDLAIVYPVTAYGAEDLTIANCRMASIDRGMYETGYFNFWGLNIENCHGLTVRNNVISDIRSTEDDDSKNLWACYIGVSTDVVVKNNLVHHIIPHAMVGSFGAILLEGFHFEECVGVEVANNTVDNLDSSEAIFINQAFSYSFHTCYNVSFTNNIASHIYSSGFPQPLARGVWASNCDVVCDFTDIYDIGPGSNGAEYHGGASPGTGAIQFNPWYIDPGNEGYDLEDFSPAQMGDPSFVDWDDLGPPSNNPDDDNPETRSRMGCHGGPDGEVVGLLT